MAQRPHCRNSQPQGRHWTNSPLPTQHKDCARKAQEREAPHWLHQNNPSPPPSSSILCVWQHFSVPYNSCNSCCLHTLGTRWPRPWLSHYPSLNLLATVVFEFSKSFMKTLLPRFCQIKILNS